MTSQTFIESRTVTCPELNCRVLLTVRTEKLPDYDSPNGGWAAQCSEISHCSAMERCATGARSRARNAVFLWDECPMDLEVRSNRSHGKPSP